MLACRCMAVVGSLRIIYIYIYVVCVFCFVIRCCSLGVSTSFSFPRADCGFLLGSFVQPLDHFGAPWVAMEVALVFLGAMYLIINKIGHPIPSSRLSSSQPVQKKWPRRVVRRIALEVAQGSQRQPHFNRAGGQDGVSLEQTLQLQGVGRSHLVGTIWRL